MSQQQTTTVLRPATTSDVESLVEMRALMFSDMGVDPGGSDWQNAARGWFLEAVDDPSVRLVVVEEDGFVVACGMAEIHHGAPGPSCPTGRVAHISNLVTRSQSRGRGHGRRCMVDLLDWTADRVDRAELHASEAGIALYRRLGFTETANPSMRRPSAVSVPRA